MISFRPIPGPLLPLLILGLTVLISWGCGKKAPPVALESIIPAPVADLRALSREGGAYLVWTFPAKNADGSKLEDLSGFKVYRRERSLSSSGCAECPQKFEPVAVIDPQYPRGTWVEGGRVLWRDESIQPQKEYIYFVLAYNSYKAASPESNQVKLSWDDPPVAPMNTAIQSEDRALLLSWDFSPPLRNGREMGGLAGFNIYRRSEGERFGFFPLNPEPLTESRYLDGRLENGKRYEYEIRAVRNVRGTLIEGMGSPVVYGIPEKRLPPSPPSGLVAVFQKEGVALRWNQNPEPDIGGYDLYRREKGGNAFSKINPHLITEPYFLDGSADPQKTYLYRLKAVDRSPSRKESEFSLEVEISFEPPRQN